MSDKTGAVIVSYPKDKEDSEVCEYRFEDIPQEMMEAYKQYGMLEKILENRRPTKYLKTEFIQGYIRGTFREDGKVELKYIDKKDIVKDVSDSKFNFDGNTSSQNPWGDISASRSKWEANHPSIHQTQERNDNEIGM